MSHSAHPSSADSTDRNDTADACIGAGGDRYWSSYDPRSPPPLSSADGHVRVVMISDTHGNELKDVPDGDILLHAGDLTRLGSTEELQEQVDWLCSLPHPIKVVIAGNHDYALDQDEKRNWYSTRGIELHTSFGYPPSKPSEAKEILRRAHNHTTAQGKPAALHYVQDELIEVEVQRKGLREGAKKKWSIWGSPWSPEYEGWAWNYKRGEEAKAIYTSLPSKVDFLLTHTPPHRLGRLDVLHDGRTHVGCEELERKAVEGECRARVWGVGHIHEARGTHLQRWEHPPSTSQPEPAAGEKAFDWMSTLLVNAAQVDVDMAKYAQERKLEYKVVSQPVIVDLAV
ncbi:Metallo-dependent phosphatase [Microstroma glucosiphilum]|uniref:Metallo-dependent phosphatase n=1 Tax=Pseudomicrostroma glucosiphilum TaxID=1684307 RepID=A0A316U040_9BASI|nr:Metallo-dependent phosphatase [Pseudomicrostroma glucosiphilum]PWN17863.1 Metallo-dependent phosphatase [Pseudomicrostroma glucosiphilum]